MKKVKEWLVSKPQFEVIERYSPSGNIHSVKRIKDGVIFNIGFQKSPDITQIKIYEFLEDCIHVRLVYVTSEKSDRQICAIDEIVLKKGIIVGWQGISESDNNTAKNYSD